MVFRNKRAMRLTLYNVNISINRRSTTSDTRCNKVVQSVSIRDHVIVTTGTEDIDETTEFKLTHHENID